MGGVKAKITPSKATKAKSVLKAEVGEEPVAPVTLKRKRRTKAEMEAAKLDIQQNLDNVTKLESPNKGAGGKQKMAEPLTMYTLKFNSPILPYAKFPLTQNKYI